MSSSTEAHRASTLTHAVECIACHPHGTPLFKLPAHPSSTMCVHVPPTPLLRGSLTLLCVCVMGALLLGVTLGEGEEDAVADAVPLPEPDPDELPDPLALPVPDAVPEPDAVAEPDPLRDDVPLELEVALPLELEVGVPLPLELELEVPLDDAVPLALPLPDAELEGELVEEYVALAVLEADAPFECVCVPLPLLLAVLEGVGVLDPDRLEEAVPDAEDDWLPEDVADAVALALSDELAVCELLAPWLCVLVWLVVADLVAGGVWLPETVRVGVSVVVGVEGAGAGGRGAREFDALTGTAARVTDRLVDVEGDAAAAERVRVWEGVPAAERDAVPLRVCVTAGVTAAVRVRVSVGVCVTAAARVRVSVTAAVRLRVGVPVRLREMLAVFVLVGVTVVAPAPSKPPSSSSSSAARERVSVRQRGRGRRREGFPDAKAIERIGSGGECLRVA